MWKPHQIGKVRFNLMAVGGYQPFGDSLIVDADGVRYTFNPEDMSSLETELARLDGAIAAIVAEQNEAAGN